MDRGEQSRCLRAVDQKIIDYCKGVDEVTMRLCRSILADECEHKYDLEMLKEEHCK